MSKVKQYYTDEVEKKVDNILTKVKNNVITKDISWPLDTII